jgi:hypothetical protein
MPVLPTTVTNLFDHFKMVTRGNMQGTLKEVEDL